MNLATREYLESQISDLKKKNRVLKDEQRALKESVDHYQLITNNVNDVIWIIDLNKMKFMYQSPSVTKLRGYTSEEAVSLPLEKTVTPKSIELARHTITEELANEEKNNADPLRSRVLELEHYCKDGSTIVAEATLSFLRDEKGNPNGILGVTRDISKRKEELNKTKAIVARSRAELEQANIALEILLKKRDDDKTNMEMNMVFNMREIISPLIDKLMMSGLDIRQKNLVASIGANINKIVSPFARNLNSGYFNLTRKEILIAKLIREGKGTKEIASLLNMSVRTVDNHRYNLRKKLGVNNQTANLATLLMSFD